MRRDFAGRYGPWAVVAGASAGLGAEFARQVAARGLNVAIVARRPDALAAVAEAIRQEHRVEVCPVVADLGERSALDAIQGALDGAEVGLLIHNAAHAPMGRFLEVPVEEALRAVDVNVRAGILLAHAFGVPMAERGRGGILLVSSLAGLQGAPYIAAYGATKAFGTVFAEGLWYELRRSGVDVLALCAGATRTPGLEASGAGAAPGALDVDAVVAGALDALGRGPVVTPGALNRVAAQLLRRLLSRRRAISLMGGQTEALLG